MITDGKPKVLIGFSGSVATLKAPELIASFAEFADIRCICSGKSAVHFIERSKAYNHKQYEKFEKSGGMDLFLSDDDEWDSWNKVGDPVLHIELRRWADILIVAPASANFIAKASSGIADNLLLSVVRAWDFEKPILVAPAMNTMMWDHPVTQQSIERLAAWGFTIVNPVKKLLACKENGNGALASVETIIAATHELLSKSIQAGNSASPTFLPILKPRRKLIPYGLSWSWYYTGYFCTFGVGILVGLTVALITETRLSIH